MQAAAFGLLPVFFSRGLPLEKAVHPFNPRRAPLEAPTAYNAHFDPGWQQA